jgi:hypothetical protein
VILDFVPPPNDQPPIPDWSDLARVNLQTGTMNDLGNITATGSSVADYEQIGLRGLAIPPSVCSAARPGVVDAPALNGKGLLALLALVALTAGTRLRRKRPNV